MEFPRYSLVLILFFVTSLSALFRFCLHPSWLLRGFSMLKTSEISNPYKKYSIQVLNHHLINFNISSSPEQIETNPEEITGPSPCLYGIQHTSSTKS